MTVEFCSFKICKFFKGGVNEMYGSLKLSAAKFCSTLESSTDEACGIFEYGFSEIDIVFKYRIAKFCSLFKGCAREINLYIHDT